MNGKPRPDFTSIFQSAPGLYLVLDPALQIIAVTDAYLSATMTVREEIVGQNLFDVFPDNPEDASATGEDNLRASLSRVIATGKPDTMAVQKYDVRRPAAEGGEFETRYWSPINSPVLREDGSVSHIVHRVEDVTDYVTHRAESEHQHEAMKAEILRRSAELQETNAQLREANDAKNEFLSRMSHELRSPLTAVIGFSELMTLDTPPDSEEHQSAAAILRAGRHLLALINEVLDIARIEARQISISLEPTALTTAIDDVLELMGPLAERRQITLEITALPEQSFVMADNQRLRQVLINLISNAIKYNHESGSVLISATVRDGNRVVVEIKDTGPGIARDNLPKLFAPFERLGAEATEIEGTGLGLALTQSLIHQMGGSIEVESELGVGSTFSIEFDLTDAVALTEREGDVVPELGFVEYPHDHRVLYIEDMAANQRLVERILERRPKVSVDTAMLGTLGIELAQELSPDLILLDLHLPDLNGAVVLQRLKADPSTRHIPVVILSADATNRQEQEVLDLGAEAYLTKPIRLAELLRTVDRFLGD